MEDKRQRVRVQGSWAGPAKRTVLPHSASRTVGSRSHSTAAGPGWVKKESSVPEKQFVFDASSEVNRKVPDPKIIEGNGTYEISTGATGVSRLQLLGNFIEPKEADWMFEQLRLEIPWKQETHVRQGVSYLEPRLTAWYGDLPYSYSRIRKEPNPHWHPLLSMLKDRIEEVTGYTFNSLLCNLYRNGKDSVDWHSDNEPSLSVNPVIASLSFGDTRVFEMRKKPAPEKNGDFTYVDRLKVPLDHGTLLIMEGATQEDWQHRVPKEYHDRGARINLTFRTIFPEPAKR
ncbi:alpha-ketoglutarate-dependent dioxygenase alkB homolog 3 [Latimeria chalumnae]|uniref:alpha-ketoglutarate-dependent dioxygenase alkB homolog 3 n=1 Tax=Latimeria chalumnae TaxID=7897 RepID=UPI0006D8EF72|nr:PREDICTED: alpha-ketoglutarate-dependent dioxygenase alkB homolog 3 [Latimeria chalumnae]|eukprot:XP_014343672.1 PREDICTED: alpha-ketoglutarate-dependent dioxygenase alkB homolog 3 [Latimeria chalumnae]